MKDSTADMPYRPQFAIDAEKRGCILEEFVYVFDLSNTPSLNGLNLGPGQSLIHIPLKLDDDADFVWWGTKIDPVSLGVLFETPWTEPLMDDYTPATLYAGNIVPTPMEAPIECPAGSVISLSLKNLN